MSNMLASTYRVLFKCFMKHLSQYGGRIVGPSSYKICSQDVPFDNDDCITVWIKNPKKDCVLSQKGWELNGVSLTFFQGATEGFKLSLRITDVKIVASLIMCYSETFPQSDMFDIDHVSLEYDNEKSDLIISSWLPPLTIKDLVHAYKSKNALIMPKLNDILKNDQHEKHHTIHRHMKSMCSKGWTFRVSRDDTLTDWRP